MYFIGFQSEMAMHEPEGPMEAFKGALRLFGTRDMLLLSVTFIYTGKDVFNVYFGNDERNKAHYIFMH